MMDGSAMPKLRASISFSTSSAYESFGRRRRGSALSESSWCVWVVSQAMLTRMVLIGRSVPKLVSPLGQPGNAAVSKRYYPSNCFQFLLPTPLRIPGVLIDAREGAF